MATLIFLLYCGFTITVLYHSIDRRIWELGTVLYLVIATFIVGIPWLVALVLWGTLIGIIACLRISSLQKTISSYLFQRGVNAIPKLSRTEEEALNAGDTWLEKNIFTGELNWDEVSKVDSELTTEEQKFLDEEVRVLCEMLNDWEITQAKDLPPEVWAFLKEKNFFGLVIDKKYGGKGFSARAHSDIIIKIASRSIAAAVTVMVPNSLGPGELLQHYGTDEQKSYYLPRLANGTEIPCFALTEPAAGSDATSIRSEAIVVEKQIDGKKTLGLELTFNKRWITLAPVATLIGIAVNVRDPQGLLHGVGEEGITCILISHDAKNVVIGNRHLPANQGFMNGTVRGEQVFAPIDSIIGGQKQAGQGWKMLVECLSIGRSISLPALSTSCAALSYLTTGAFARVRRQFNVEIGEFEGVQEKLAEIAGLSYIINAQRLFTIAAVTRHKKPSVASAITKYYNTEFGRIILNNAMDVHAGRAVVLGQRNYLANFYQSAPMLMTVEGANIMTRNLLIFGQGSMACHPYIREELYAITKKDKQAFHELIWQHISYFGKNFARALGTAWTGGWLIFAKTDSKRDYQRLARLSYAFAWLADLALIVLGGNLKRKERLSARLADGLSYLYMGMAVLRYEEKYGANEEEQLHVKWAMSYCFYHAQKAMIAFCRNLPTPILGVVARFVLFPFGQTMRYPNDKLDYQLSKLMVQNNEFRQNLAGMIYLSGDPNEPVDKMEQALQAIISNQSLYGKIKELKRFEFERLQEKLLQKVKAGELSEQDMKALMEVEALRWDAIQVDEFAFESLKKKSGTVHKEAAQASVE